MSIRRATPSDVSYMVDLSEQKRAQYEKFQPLFWRKAIDSREKQLLFFKDQLKNENLVFFVDETDNKVDGFIIANLRNRRECDVDDFAVANENLWESSGKLLLQEAGKEAKQRSIERYSVVCGHLDEPKRQMLTNFGLVLEQYWYTAAIQSTEDTVQGITVRKAVPIDASQMARIAGTPEREFAEIQRDNMIVLVCEQENNIIGYAISIVISTPPVYDPGGQTCLVIESTMHENKDWLVAGKALLNAIQYHALQQKAVQYVVICDENQSEKQNVLQEAGLTIASEWYGGKIQ